MSKAPTGLSASLVVRKDQVAADVKPPSPEAPKRREGLTIRILADDNDRLRELAFKTRMTKQALLDEAIRQYLDKMEIG